jgi:glutamine synthetase type III
MKNEAMAGVLADSLGDAIAEKKVAEEKVANVQALLIEAAGDYNAAPQVMQGQRYAFRVYGTSRSSCPMDRLLQAIADRCEISLDVLQEIKASVTETATGLPAVRAVKMNGGA